MICALLKSWKERALGPGGKVKETTALILRFLQGL